MTTETTDRSELIVPCILAHLASLSAVTDRIGRTPMRLFPGGVPLKADGSQIDPPYMQLQEQSVEEEMHFGGGTGIFKATYALISVAETYAEARLNYATVRKVLNGKWSVTWNKRLRIGESQCSGGGLQPLLGPDGYPMPWQQIVGELFLLCEVLPLT